MTKFYAYTIGLCAALLMVGCTKEDADQAAPTSKLTAKETMLTAKNWRITAISATGTVTAEGISPIATGFDGYTRLTSCQKDNFAKYNIDKTIVADEGATKCSTTDPQTQIFTWSLNADETELTVSGKLNGTDHTEKAELLQLTSTTMQLRTTTVVRRLDVTSTTKTTTTYIAF
ncbi:hypothetical protein MUN82_14525 [Hymenobacter aerilatus]|uniref:Lipocalin-like domain-containing protein n=1 Tax=Hymenobacter aerilatus TaxID=2932251 RepID=A0A8T9SWI7_9BACT|nr:hypothetical protein [Hymenobacter aerilatus]UOR04156.1 hypothetical protein MUN82_14525 [Hymenobacter aerilatus]